jgi:hypothetical protein
MAVAVIFEIKSAVHDVDISAQIPSFASNHTSEVMFRSFKE